MTIIFDHQHLGTWLDGMYGWRNMYRCVDLAVSHGMELDAEAAHELELCRQDQHDPEIMEEVVNEATQYLQDRCALGYFLVWDMGELYLTDESADV